MKNKALILIGIMAAALFAGCSGDEAKKDATTATDALKSYTEKAVNDGKHALDSVKNFTIEQKDAFVKAVSEASAATVSEITRLSAKSATLTGDAKVQADKAISELKAASDRLVQELGKLKAVTKDSWEATRDSVGKAWDDTKAALDKAKKAIEG